MDGSKLVVKGTCPSGTSIKSDAVYCPDGKYTLSSDVLIPAGVYISAYIKTEKLLLNKSRRNVTGKLSGNVQMLLYLDAGTYDFAVQVSLVPGTTAPTVYTPYRGDTLNLALPSTIYGGTVDAVTGEGMETWKTRALNGSEGWGEADDGAFYFYDTITYPTINAVSSRKCSHFMDYSGAAWTGLPNGYFSTNGVSIRFRLDSIADVAAWKSFLSAQAAAGTPVTIAYKLATPEPFQATGGQSLPALPGTNTIYTDADSVTVTGRADPVQIINALNDRIAALEDAATGG